MLRERIRKAFPDHGIIGEEFGREREDAEFVWVLDPIDGTKSFISGVPLFGTLIALARHGHPIVGIIDQPISRERWIGAAGRPTLFNGAPVRVRPCASLAAATLFVAITIPLARFTDWLILRDRRRRQTAGVAT